MFFSLDTPGSRYATYDGGDAVVLFDNAYADVNGVESRDPVIIGRDADLPGVAQGSTIVVGGVKYTVATVEPDGHGVLIMQLERL